MRTVTIELDDVLYANIEVIAKEEEIPFNEAVEVALWGFILDEAIRSNRLRDKNLQIMSEVVT